MAKPKAQKVKEAIERARAILPKHRANYLEVCSKYEKNLKQFGRAVADKLQSQAAIEFRKACERAHCDAHGNPID